MKTLRAATAILATAILGALATAAPAAAIMPVVAGSVISNAKGSWCTVSFPDPVDPTVVYTAAHCYRKDATEVRFGTYPLGRYIPEIYSQKLDLMAIRLYPNVASDYRLIKGDRIDRPWVVQPGSEVCKYGSTTFETCGTVLAVTEDRIAVQMEADHGDSGGPVYQRTTPTSNEIHIVGTVLALDPNRPDVILCSPITSINSYLRTVWGSNWGWDSRA